MFHYGYSPVTEGVPIRRRANLNRGQRQAREARGRSIPQPGLQAEAEVAVMPEMTGNHWRERMGVEPTMDAAGRPSTDLKSAELTGTQSLPRVQVSNL